MKKILIAVVLILGLITTPQCFAVQDTREIGALSSGDLTSDGAVYSAPGVMTDIAITGDGTNECSIILYDNKTAGGTVVWRQTVLAADKFGGAVLRKKFGTGLYLDMTTDGTCTVNVGYLVGTP